jgi:hypothetical protein
VTSSRAYSTFWFTTTRVRSGVISTWTTEYSDYSVIRTWAPYTTTGYKYTYVYGPYPTTSTTYIRNRRAEETGAVLVVDPAPSGSNAEPTVSLPSKRHAQPAHTEAPTPTGATYPTITAAPLPHDDDKAPATPDRGDGPRHDLFKRRRGGGGGISLGGGSGLPPGPSVAIAGIVWTALIFLWLAIM